MITTLQLISLKKNIGLHFFYKYRERKTTVPQKIESVLILIFYDQASAVADCDVLKIFFFWVFIWGFYMVHSLCAVISQYAVCLIFLCQGQLKIDGKVLLRGPLRGLLNVFCNPREDCNKHKNIFAYLFSIHNTISLSRHEQVCLSRLHFERYLSHH